MRIDPSSLRTRPRGPSGRRAGFTLLEIVVAVTVLATFLLPMMLIITKSKVRAVRYTQQREVRDFAQRKLFDRMHYYEEKDQGDFSAEGRPEWTWEIDPPEMVGSGEQILLEYRIRVHLPQNLEEDGAPSSEGSTYEMCIWSFPDERWYEEQDALYAQGQYSPLYGNPRY
jgi:prepilin-type N-terminal cleavage/methylation domain-containing protein